MTVTLGLYDLFSYMTPGLLVIYIVNESLKYLKWGYIDVQQLSIAQLIVLAAIAYLVGHLFSALGHFVWFKRKYPFIAQRALEKLKKGFPNLEINYHPKEWIILLEVLQRRNSEAIGKIENFKAISVMMRSTTVGMILLVIYEAVISIFRFSVQNILFALVLFVAANLAYRWGQRHDEWYYRSIFGQAISYGNDLQSFLHNEKPFWKNNSLEATKENDGKQ